tara:strand:+ start:81 stop:479 length:399 start_codon:yes stop_codon:yes gene_type:complete
MATQQDVNKIKNKYAWFVERNQCGLVEKSNSGGWISVTEVKPVRMFVIKTADPLTGVSTQTHNHLEEEPELPTQFHMGVVYKAISDLYRTPENLNMEMAQAFELEYMKAVKRGKKYSKKGHITTGRVIGVDF